MKLVKLYIFRPILNFALYVFTSCFFGLFRALPPLPFLTTKAICFQQLLFLKPDPSLTVVFLLSFFSVAVQAGVTAVYHNGNEITVKYNAEHEFSAHQFLSAMENERNKIFATYPDLNDIVRNHCVTYPVCKAGDEICAQYVREVKDIRKEIRSAFQRERVLYEQKEGAWKEHHIYEKQWSYTKASIEQEQIWLRDIDKVQTFILELMENQNEVLKILIHFQESNPEFEYDNQNVEERIAKIKEWLIEKYPYDTIFSVFLNDIETMFKSQNQRREKLISNLYSALLSGNSELLQSFWDFTEETKNRSHNKIDSLTVRLKEISQIGSSLGAEIRRINKEKDNLWARVKTLNAKKVYPRTVFYGAREWFPNCRNCAIP